MRPEDIRKYRNRQPFVPFRMMFTDGRTVEIPHPDYLFVTPHLVDVAVSVDQHTGLPAETIIASPLHVVRLEYLKPVPDEG
jgi:hypothetical protein